MASPSSIIFPTGSPVDRADGSLLTPVFKPGRLRKLANRYQSLIDSRKTLDKVYSNGYFSNHYPEADKVLKNGLHEQTMQALAKATNPDDTEPEGDEGGLNLNITINLGK